MRFGAVFGITQTTRPSISRSPWVLDNSFGRMTMLDVGALAHHLMIFSVVAF
jgi:hypothetical protein